MRLVDRLKNSLYERSRHLTLSRQCRELAHELGVDPARGGNLHTLQTIASCKALLRDSADVLVDIGAHKGVFTRAAMQALGCSRAICIEPDADLGPVLREAVSGFNAVVHQVALSSTAGTAEFHVYGDRSMSSLLEADQAILREKFPNCDARQVDTRTVPIFTLDQIVAEEEKWEDRSYFIKIDTQGNEMDVLLGADGTLERTCGCLIEYMFCSPYGHENRFLELVQHMDQRGFDCAGALDIIRRPTHEVSGVDFLFVPRAMSAVNSGASKVGSRERLQSTP